MKGLNFRDQRILELTTEDYQATIHRAYVLESLWKANCFRSNDDRGPRDTKENPIPRAVSRIVSGRYRSPLTSCHWSFVVIVRIGSESGIPLWPVTCCTSALP